MDAKNELLELIKDIVKNENTINQIHDVLQEYNVSRVVHNNNKEIKKQLQYFLNAKRIDGLSSKTILNYKQTLSFFANHVNKSVDTICIDDIRDYLSFLTEERRLKMTSIQTHINTLKSFFSWLVIEEAISKNPMSKIHVAKIDRRGLRHAMSAEELERLRDACVDYREKAFVEFFVSTGCRLSEAVNIKVDEINWTDRSVVVHGKGSKDRTVYFSQRAKLMIQEYLNSRGDGEILFSGKRLHNKPIQPRSIQKVFRIIGERAGLKQRVHPHLLRHTFATTAINRGMDITVIQALLGHEDVSTTQIYATLSNSSVQHAYNKFAA